MSLIIRLIFAIISFSGVLKLSCQELPQGFEFEVYAQGLELPTSMTFSPDGRLFITEKSGEVKIVQNGELLDQSFIQIDTEFQGERGLNGLALDPDYEFNKYVYLYYSVPDSNLNQIIRVKDAGNTAAPGTEELLFKFDKMWAEWHNGGAMLFGDDGKLYVAIGDGTAWDQSQNLNSTLGKVFRLNSDGTIPADNPFYNQLDGKYKGIWSNGLRNPFSMSKSLSSGRIFINDVGNNTYEEINELLPGANFGWNLIEGPIQSGITPPSNYYDPIYSYNHNDGCAIVGACFYEPSSSAFPSEFLGKYFFMDYCNGWIRNLDPNTNEVSDFATGFSKSVAISFDESGDLYVLDFDEGKVFKISYSGSSLPHIYSNPQNIIAAIGETINFTVEAISESTMSYQWFRNDVEILNNSNTLEISNTNISMNGDAFFCIASNSAGADTSNIALLEVIDGSRPEITIQHSLENSNYHGGDTLFFSAIVTDPDEPFIPASNYSWSIDFHHNVHTHPAMQNVSGITEGFFTIPSFGETATDVWYRINLVVFDSDGLSQTESSDIFPELCSINIESTPTSVYISADGNSHLSPYEVLSVKGMNRTFLSPSHIIQSDRLFKFKEWNNDNPNETFHFTATDTTVTCVFEDIHEYFEGVPNNYVTVKYYSGIGDERELYETNEVEIIDEYWTVFSPFRWSEDFPIDSFSVDYFGSILAPYTGHYTFQILHDGNINFTLEDSLMISEEFGGNVIENGYFSVNLEAGEYYNFILKYEHVKDFSRLGLKWNFSIIEDEIIPGLQLFPANFESTILIPANSNYSLFPNPVNDQIIIASDFSLAPVTIEIFNQIGQLVYSEIKMPEGNSNLPIEIFHLRSGVYIMRIETEGETESLRFVKGEF